MNIQSLGAAANDRSDTISFVHNALEACRDRNDRRLIFPPGRYDFWPDKAEERYLFISNNTEGLKRIAFPLFNLDGFEIEGQNAHFVFHGPILPFAVLDSRDIRLSGFSVDWERPFHSEGRITEVGDGWVDLEFSDAFPFEIRERRLVFLGERGEELGFNNLLAFDSAKRETAFQAEDNYGIETRHSAHEIQPGRVRLTAALAGPMAWGNTLVFGSNHRKFPGIFVSGSRRVEVEGVTLHHCGGMGIIAQLTTDIAVRRVHVTPPPGRGRLVSLTADAVHCVSCRGKVEIADCLFENQMDDAINIHGVYARTEARLAARTLEVALIHPEQQGIDLFVPGDTAELVRAGTLATYGAGTLAAVRRLNKQRTLLSFTQDLPADIRPGDAAVCREANPDVFIRGCLSRGNRARGFLISTGGHVLIESNYFHTPGAALLVAGDADYWYEAGPVSDLTIRDNHFDNCNYGVWGAACIDICPEIAQEQRSGNGYHQNINAYHQNIAVVDNRFDVFDPRLVRAYCVRGLTIAGNVVCPTTAYPRLREGAELFAVTNSQDVSLQDVSHAAFFEQTDNQNREDQRKGQ